jgi:glycosyltransferase involved in cell wall biosynthesis
MVDILMAAYTNYRRDPRVRREAEALVAAGHRVVFLARRQAREHYRETIAGVDVIKVRGLTGKCTSIAEYVFDYTTFAAQVCLHLFARPRRYQLIHINNMPDFLVFAAWLPRMLGRPVIHDVHDLMPELYAEEFASGDRHWGVRVLKAQERWAGRFATAVLTVEARMKDILSSRGIDENKIHVLMNLPDERIFSPRPSSAPKAADAPFVMVYHGTLARRLGLDVAIEALARVRPTIPRVELRIIGAGEERDRLIQLSRTFGLEDAVTFSDGYVPLERIPALIGDADLGLIPLRISSGTDVMLPTKLLEYVSVGIPCIVPRTATITRYFDADMVEFFEAENVDSLAGAMLRLFQDPARCARLSHEATERFGKLYSWRVHKEVYTDLVARLLADTA